MTDTPTSWVRWRSVQVRTGIFVALAAAAGLYLDLAIIGTAPERAAESAEVVPAPETAVEPTTVEPTTVEPTTVEPTAVEPTTVNLAVPPPSDPTTDPTSPSTAPPPAGAASPVGAPAPVPVAPVVADPVAAPVAPAPAAAPPATTAARAPSPTPAPATVAPTAPATTAPTTTAATTVPPTTAPAAATTAPPTTAAPTGEQLTYDVASIGGQVVVEFVDRSSLSLVTVQPGSGWVYDVEQNGPRTVKLKFYNVNSGRDAEWKATVESGRIQIEN